MSRWAWLTDGMTGSAYDAAVDLEDDEEGD